MFRKIYDALCRQTELLERQTALQEKQNELLERMNTLLAAADFGDEVYDGIQNIMTYGGMRRDA